VEMLFPEEVTKDQMYEFHKKSGGIQKSRRRTDLIEQHRKKKNQMDWPNSEAKIITQECNRKVNREKSPKKKANG
jgi:hypothetical protein